MNPQRTYDWLWRHPGALVGFVGALGSMVVMLGTALAFGLTTPRTEITRIDSRVDTIGLRMDSVRLYQRSQAVIHDSTIRVLRALLAVQCIQLDLPPVVKAVIPCDEAWQALERSPQRRR